MRTPITETPNIEEVPTLEVVTPSKPLIKPQSFIHKILVVLGVYLAVDIFLVLNNWRVSFFIFHSIALFMLVAWLSSKERQLYLSGHREKVWYQKYFVLLLLVLSIAYFYGLYDILKIFEMGPISESWNNNLIIILIFTLPFYLYWRSFWEFEIWEFENQPEKKNKEQRSIGERILRWLNKFISYIAVMSTWPSVMFVIFIFFLLGSPVLFYTSGSYSNHVLEKITVPKNMQITLSECNNAFLERACRYKLIGTKQNVIDLLTQPEKEITPDDAANTSTGETESTSRAYTKPRDPIHIKTEEWKALEIQEIESLLSRTDYTKKEEIFRGDSNLFRWCMDTNISIKKLEGDVFQVYLTPMEC